MLACDISEMYGLTGHYLLDYCAIYSEDYKVIESISDSNPIKSELIYVYLNGSVAKYISDLATVMRFEELMFQMEDDFSKEWQLVGGGELNLNDIAVQDLQSRWELLYMLNSVYWHDKQDYEVFIAPVEAIMRGIVQDIWITNQPTGYVSNNLH